MTSPVFFYRCCRIKAQIEQEIVFCFFFAYVDLEKVLVRKIDLIFWDDINSSGRLSEYMRRNRTVLYRSLQRP